MTSPTLLELLQTVIERTYRMDTGIRDIHRFVVGDRGLSRVYGASRVVLQVGSPHAEAKVLVREGAGSVHANIYYPDALIAGLEARNPLQGLGEENLDLFAVFVEELDHLLTLADRARAGRGVSLFELELHANVTKYVAARHFLRRTLGRPLLAGERLWLKWSLFEKLLPSAESPEVRARYHDADRLARRYADFLDRLAPCRCLEELRAFHQRSPAHAVRVMQAALA